MHDFLKKKNLIVAYYILLKSVLTKDKWKNPVH